MIELKSQISYQLNQQLYILKSFQERPADIVLLGDSRTQSLNSATIEYLTGVHTANLAYGASSIPDIVDTFWYILKLHSVKEVYIGLNFNLYNEYNNYSKVTEAISLLESPYLYLFSKYCYKSLYLIIKANIIGRNVELGKPQMSREEFWNYQLDSTASSFYRNYKYPTRYQDKLLQIASYCKENNIKLIFFIPPTHVALQKRVRDFNLESEEREFKLFLFSLGTTLDFDYPNELTSSENNFLDPFHCNDSISEIIVREITTRKGNYLQFRTDLSYN